MAFLARTAISGNPIAGAIGEAYNSMCSHVRVLGDAPRPRRRTARNRAGVWSPGLPRRQALHLLLRAVGRGNNPVSGLRRGDDGSP